MSSDRGQSATIGVLLVTVLTLMAATAVIALGSTALTDTQQRSELSKAEHSMTQFDSLASQVGLGESDTQTVDFGKSGGSYHINSTAGQIRIVHANFNGTYDGVDTSTPNDEVIYKGDLGAVLYENRDRTIAYQGGGVWRKDPNGATRMISPPEFHYRASTLTLPVIKVSGDGSSSGNVRATVERIGEPVEIYPDDSTEYPATADSPAEPYSNPATNGTVFADIKSEYYEAWAEYFRSRTEGNVTVFHNNQTTRVQLIGTGFTGNFQMPPEGSSIEVRGVEDHSMKDFSIRIVDDQDDEADMSNLKWSLWVQDGDRQFEIHVRRDSGQQCPTSDPIIAKAVVYYSPADGDGDTDDPYHGWKNTTAYKAHCEDVNSDDNEETVLEIDFIDDEDNDKNVSEIEQIADPDVANGDPNLTYQSLGSSDLMHFKNPNDELLMQNHTSPRLEFSEHKDAVYWEPRTYNTSTVDSTPYNESVDRIFNHYFSLLGPGFDLTVEDKANGNTVAESLSAGKIDYQGANRFVTYMHITENRVQIRLTS